uniref:NOP protein chaperone 1 n=1 Tax=Lepisosteus oculatus TaxID=7918 RepID=W5ND14_LEPOC|nr:PREDICTED: uncharacterized protein C12orf45 homolog [Lepisosteus oculatus]
MGDSEQADGRPDKPISHELLSCGRGGALQDKLLLKPRSSKSGGTLQTVKVPRSNVLDRLQCFLPQMAQANEKLRQQMESSPANLFDIENIEESSDKVIEMVRHAAGVALWMRYRIAELRVQVLRIISAGAQILISALYMT